MIDESQLTDGEYSTAMAYRQGQEEMRKRIMDILTINCFCAMDCQCPVVHKEIQLLEIEEYFD